MRIVINLMAIIVVSREVIMMGSLTLIKIIGKMVGSVKEGLKARWIGKMRE